MRPEKIVQKFLNSTNETVDFYEKTLNETAISEYLNETNKNLNTEYDYVKYCGFNNCPKDPLPVTSSKPGLQSVYLLCGALIFLCLLALLITICFVDNISDDDDNAETGENKKPKITLSLMSNFKL